MIGSVELRVIQATLRMDANRDDAIKNTLQHPLDWARLQRLAMQHGVLPLVYKGLKEVAPNLVPPKATLEMDAFQHINERRTFLMTANLIKVVRALEAKHIPVICLKGPVLATLFYSDPALRAYVDLDILVKLVDYSKAEAILYTFGLELAHKTDRHAHFQSNLCPIELHWRIATKEYPRTLDSEYCFKRSTSVQVSGHLCSTLCAEDLVLHTCLHGTQHCWSKFRYLTDFATALQMLDADQLETVCKTAREQGLYRPMLVSIQLSHKLLGITPSKKILHTNNIDFLAWLTVRLVCSYLGRASEAGADLFDSLVFKLLTAEKKRYHEIKSLAKTMFTPTRTDYHWIPLPDSIYWLYFILRPCRRFIQGVSILCARNRP